uniref:Paralemmin-1-like n=1 Tax=Gouania willdenowi TaxID=441366 RepID=A0A8C5EGB0_GOUWI
MRCITEPTPQLKTPQHTDVYQRMLQHLLCLHCLIFFFLQRKSLRDQWLMEGAPLSPTSPVSQSPRSPLLSTLEKLQSECERLAEHQEKIESCFGSPLCCVGGEESAQASNANIIEEEEEEEEAVVMRAECVIITDEGDDIPEVQTFYVHDEKSVKVIDGLEAEASEMVIKTETVSVTFSELDKNLATEAQPTVEDKDIETHSDVHEEPALEHLQAPANALEGAAVALVPVYSEAPSSSFSPKAEAEEEAVVHVEDAAFVPGQFQEVSLADCQGNHRTAAGPGEQEPLLSEVKTESREGVGQAPKRKACQCCSVM